jgi:hypothetical protein
MLATPRNEFPAFPAALSFLFGLTPTEAGAALGSRALVLRESLAALDREIHNEAGPPRLFLIETEYIRAVTAAELQWVESVADDLRAGRLAWKIEDFPDIAKNFTPPDPI